MNKAEARPSRPFEVTNRSVLAIAVPMTLAYLSTPLLGIVDTAVIGQLGSAALLGAIAVGAIVFDVLFTTFNFIRTGTTAMVAQALGAGDEVEEVAVFWRAMVIAMIAGLGAILLQWPLLWLALYFMNAASDVNEAVEAYYKIRIYSAPFALGNYAVLGFLLGLGRAGLGLLLQTFLNGLNIVLNMTFVLKFGWGVEGVALGTLIAEAVTLVAGMALAARFFGNKMLTPLTVIFDRPKFRRMLGVNRDIMIRSFALLFAFAFFSRTGAQAGTVTLAANAVLFNLFFIGAYFLDGFAQAAEQLAGRAIGANWRPAFDRTVRLTLIWGYVLAGSVAFVYLFTGPYLIDFITTNEAARAEAREYLFWAVITPLVGVLAFQMDGVFIGSTWSADMRNMMLVSLAVYLLAIWALTPIYGNHALWFAFQLFLIVRGVTLAWRCRARRRTAFQGSLPAE